MKIREGFVLREIADTIIVVPTGELVKELRLTIELNKTGKFMWELLKEDISIEEIANKLVEEYGIDKEKAIDNAQKFTQKLKQAKIIEE